MKRLLLLTWCLMLLGCSFPALLAQSTGEQRIVKKIDIIGLEEVDKNHQLISPTPAILEKEIRRVLKSKENEQFNEETALADEETILNMGWFLKLNHEIRQINNEWHLVFTVVENPVLTSVEFKGNTVYSSDDLRALIGSKAGRIINRETIKVDAQKIKEAYFNDKWKRHYTLVDITDLKVTDEGKLVIYILEPTIDEIRIVGNKKTYDYVITRELGCKVGDIYNEKSLQDTLRNLNRLSIFKEVNVTPKLGSKPGTVMIEISVSEDRTGQAGVGIGSSNIQGWVGFVDYSERNFFGTGQSVNARVEFGTDKSYELGYVNPYIDSHHTSLSISLYDRLLLSQTLFNNQTYTFDDNRRGGRIAVSRPFGDWSYGIALRAEHMLGTDLQTGFPAALDIGLAHDVRSITPSATYDTRDQFMNPRAGSYFQLSSEFAGLGGDSKFTKINGEVREYWDLLKNKHAADKKKKPDASEPMPLILASRLKAGMIIANATFLDQFRVGGADTVRGYPDEFYAGSRMVLLNNELRLPLNEVFQLVTFFDLGTAWGGEFAKLAGNPNMQLHHGYGFGIRIQTPIGPLRLDYGISSRGNQIHFGVGATY